MSFDPAIKELGGGRYVEKRIVVIMELFSEYRHKDLTKQLRACDNSKAFSQTSEGALFLPGAKQEKPPSFLRWLFLFLRHPHREGTRAGYLKGGSVVRRST